VALTSGEALGIVSMPIAGEVKVMVKATRRYSAKLKFQVVLEALRGEKTPGQIAKAYGVHANSVGIWKQQLLERGPAVFEGATAGSDSERRIAELEQLLGKKEVEIALLKNFLARTN
jgi:transposase-like protein